MALSRICSAFIIIAIVAAAAVFIAGNERQVFAAMVTGKKGDSVQVKEMAIAGADPLLLGKLDSNQRVQQGDLI